MINISLSITGYYKSSYITQYNEATGENVAFINMMFITCDNHICLIP